ncbi:MAG: glycosyltransferase [Bacteroidia bacterium]|nr:glycosyltransferase [Bacteroidia bacterium]
MRILQLTNKFPYPPRDGGAIATLNISKALARQGHGVTVLAMNTTKHFFNPMDLPEKLSEEILFHSVKIDNDISSFQALKSLVMNRSYNVQRFLSRAYTEKLRELLRNNGPFDVVQLEGIYLAPYISIIRENSNALISLRAHNIEHLIWERRARNEHTIFRRSYLTLLARQLRRFETEQLKNIDVLVPISPVDELGFRNLGFTGPVHMCPASFDEQEFCSTHQPPSHKNIFFLGALDWAPNLEGLRWFIREVWRKVIAYHPDLLLHIAGRNMPEEIKFLHAPNVNVLGEVEDAVHFMSLHNMMIVPLFSGSGMRVKIVEGMALGKVIITTPVGAEGIRAQNGTHFLVADDADSFAKAILRCLGDETLCRELSAQASRFAHAHFGNMATTAQLTAFYQKQRKS